MSGNVDKLNKRGVKTSYASTIIGISLVLFMIGIVLGGIFGLENITDSIPFHAGTKIENGKVNATIHSLYIIAVAMNKELSDLVVIKPNT